MLYISQQFCSNCLFKNGTNKMVTIEISTSDYTFGYDEQIQLKAPLFPPTLGLRTQVKSSTDTNLQVMDYLLISLSCLYCCQQCVCDWMCVLKWQTSFHRVDCSIFDLLPKTVSVDTAKFSIFDLMAVWVFLTIFQIFLYLKYCLVWFSEDTKVELALWYIRAMCAHSSDISFVI